MSVDQIISHLFSVLWVLLPLLLLVGLFNSAWFKGVLGELLVNLMLRFSLNNEEYYLINNVTLPTEDGTTQIDHIVVSPYGVFVIETKNMKGWIFGTEFQKEWTQKIFKYSGIFQNPLHQNYKHTKTLEKLLDLGDHQIFSVVVFVGESTFKTVMPVNVVYGRDLVHYIQMKKHLVLSEGEVDKIIDQIESGRLSRSIKTNQIHQEHVSEMIGEKFKTEPQVDIEGELHGPNCPQCGSSMTLRVGSRGQYKANPFWGCTSFPYCRSVKSLMERES